MFDSTRFTVDVPRFNVPVILGLAIGCWLPVAAMVVALN